MVTTLTRRGGADPTTSAGAGAPDRAAGAAKIALSSVTKRFVTPAGSVFTAIRDFDLVIEPGQFCAIVGPTGCGKSTTLSLVSGLDRPTAGSVWVGDGEVDGIASGMSFMFQT